jgi:outer membrane immunogenic protein
MKKLLLSMAVLAGMGASTLTSTALAADLPRRVAPPVYSPPPLPAFTWSGFYLGVNAGGIFPDKGDLAFRGDPAVVGPLIVAGIIPPNAGLKSDGFIGGGQIGYNWQVSPAWVLGIESDFQGTSLSKDFAFTNGGATTVASANLDWFGTTRGRIGWLLTPQFMLYGTGGVAYANASASFALTAPGVFAAGSVSDTQVGWTAGGGVEWAFWNNWSAKAEYLFYDLGHRSASTVVAGGGIPPGAFLAADRENSGSIARIGLNYRFGYAPAPAYSAPVVTRY